MEKDIRRLIENGDLTRDDLLILEEWTNQMRQNGPAYIQGEKKWRDFTESDGKYVGYRSSSLGIWNKRVIYDVQKDEIIIIEVVAIDTKYYTREKNNDK